MASMIIDNSIHSIRTRFIIICGMILLWLYFTSLFLPSKKLPITSSESPSDVLNDSRNRIKKQVVIGTNDQPVHTDTSPQTSTSSTTTTTKRTTLPAVVFIPKPTKSTTAKPSSSGDTPTPSFSTSGLNVTNDNITVENSGFFDNSSNMLRSLVNDNDNVISKTNPNYNNVWDHERTQNSDSEFLGSEEEGSGSGSGLGSYDISTPEYLEDLLNYKRVYPRFKNPINEEYLHKIARD